ncbi:4'-phosphopantetheinyl transferase family protein [Flavobacterium branchiicola]|uniref:4'-phosphopantetheinyl transferase superfamily protein n=1 Tax=Flavobacterium branchiicola TaxID=1114875 RepID=A0ABV9PBG7_9FLAO|nr:4'-phosphopantetheinyl transferase superfamily protein [Flavobacterium branchiicola]MBS7253620.1 4-phosphopantetheinyl transferase family protein [Flavobacterium branchiicola]
MIGNDVIDLAQSRIESRWQRKGFLEKIFTPDEQQLVKIHQDQEIMVWLLWSMKEAAYKIYNRQTKIREYSPQKLSCTINSVHENEASGQVICNENIYYTKTVISSESIHTIAVCLFKDINSIIEVKEEGIVKDKYGIPYLKTSSSNTLKNISISRHGRFEKLVIIN